MFIFYNFEHKEREKHLRSALQKPGINLCQLVKGKNSEEKKRKKKSRAPISAYFRTIKF